MDKNEFREKFKSFLMEWPSLEEQKYYQIIRKLSGEEKRSLEIDFENLLDYSQELALIIAGDPESGIQYDEAIEICSDVFKELYSITYIRKKLHVRFYNMITNHVQISKIGAESFGTPFEFTGLVRRVSGRKPEVFEAVFECIWCGQLMPETQDPENPFLIKPAICVNPACGKNTGIKERIDLDQIADCQILSIQESPETVRGGRMPQSIDCYLRDDLVESARPGNYVKVVGIIRPFHDKEGGKEKKTFNYYIDIQHITIEEQDTETLDITEDEIKQFHEMAKQPYILNNIIQSICPTIYGNEDIKMALALAIFGGNQAITGDGTRLRGDINILLVGDPSVGKSQLLKFIINVASKAIYVSGKGASGVGLTAAVVHDEFSKKWAVEAGALVLADGGLCLIDELDKMSKDDRDALHEAMEQGTVSINKAGINVMLNARTKIIAACNPKLSRFNRYANNKVEQIDLPSTLLSRFDIVIIMEDVPSKEKDGLIAEHILEMHENPKKIQPKIPLELLKKYIWYSQRHITPHLSKKASTVLKKFYQEKRDQSDESSPMQITNRQLEGLIRLSTARARALFKEEVTEEDAKETIALYERILKEVAFDTATGKIDIDTLMTGTRKSQRDKITQFIDIIDKIEAKHDDDGAPEEEIFEEAMNDGLTESFVREYLGKMKHEGEIMEPKPGIIKRVRVL